MPLADELEQTRPGPGAEPTLHLPEHAAEPGGTHPGPQPAAAQPTINSEGFKPIAVARQVEGLPPASDRRRVSPLWWILLAVIIGGSGVAIALILTRDRRQDRTIALSPATPTAPTTPAVSTTSTASKNPAASTTSTASKSPAVSTAQSVSPAVEAAKKITGQWLLWREGHPRGKSITTMRITADGTNIVVSGREWTGRGSFDGQRGYYDWQFTDGKRGRTTIRFDAEGKLHGEVRGSGIDWNYQALRR